MPRRNIALLSASVAATCILAAGHAPAAVIPGTMDDSVSSISIQVSDSTPTSGIVIDGTAEVDLPVASGPPATAGGISLDGSVSEAFSETSPLMTAPTSWSTSPPAP